MTIGERKKEALKEELQDVAYLIRKNNDSINYFGKKMMSCYLTLISVASINASKLDVDNYTNDEYSYSLLEECKDNVKAYMNPEIRKHSELFYFLEEMERMAS